MKIKLSDIKKFICEMEQDGFGGAAEFDCHMVRSVDEIEQILRLEWESKLQGLVKTTILEISEAPE